MKVRYGALIIIVGGALGTPCRASDMGWLARARTAVAALWSRKETDSSAMRLKEAELTANVAAFKGKGLWAAPGTVRQDREIDPLDALDTALSKSHPRTWGAPKELDVRSQSSEGIGLLSFCTRAVLSEKDMRYDAGTEVTTQFRTSSCVNTIAGAYSEISVNNYQTQSPNLQYKIFGANGEMVFSQTVPTVEFPDSGERRLTATIKEKLGDGMKNQERAFKVDIVLLTEQRCIERYAKWREQGGIDWQANYVEKCKRMPIREVVSPGVKLVKPWW